MRLTLASASAAVAACAAFGAFAPGATGQSTVPPPENPPPGDELNDGQFSCRASAVRTNVLGLLFLSTEPVVANTARVPCADEAKTARTAAAGPARADVLNAATDRDPGGHPGGHATASAASFGVALGGQSIAATVLRSEATSRCRGGSAVFSSAGEVLGLTINGKPTSVGAGSQAIPVAGLGTVYINRVFKTNNAIVHRALEIDAPALMTNVVVAESIADVHRCAVDRIIDADGIETRFSGDPHAREVAFGDALDDFPQQVFNGSGLDMFDQDGNHEWTMGPAGDDLHAEGPAFCPLAVRGGSHDLGRDCKVLDIDDGLAQNEPVDCDVELGLGFTFGPDPCPPTRMRYHDRNGNNAWDSGEDIVLDVDHSGVFD